MPREVSAAVRNLLDASAAETHDVADIYLPLMPGETELDRITYHVAFAENVTIDGITYAPMLRQIGTIKFSLGKAPDNADLALENVSKVFGITLTDTSRRLDGAKVVIKRAFRIEGDFYEAVPLFFGYVREVRVDQDFVRLALVSDMSRRNAQVASRAVSQRCIWTFRGVECGWVEGQGGNSVYCSKVFDAADGCSGHNNQPRFGGVPTLSPKVREIIAGLGPLGDGWEDPNNRGLRGRLFDLDYGAGRGYVIPHQAFRPVGGVEL